MFKKIQTNTIGDILEIQKSTLDLIGDLQMIVKEQTRVIQALEESVEQLQRLALKAEL